MREAGLPGSGLGLIAEYSSDEDRADLCSDRGYLHEPGVPAVSRTAGELFTSLSADSGGLSGVDTLQSGSVAAEDCSSGEFSANRKPSDGSDIRSVSDELRRDDSRPNAGSLLSTAPLGGDALVNAQESDTVCREATADCVGSSLSDGTASAAADVHQTRGVPAVTAAALPPEPRSCDDINVTPHRSAFSAGSDTVVAAADAVCGAGSGDACSSDGVSSGGAKADIAGAECGARVDFENGIIGEFEGNVRGEVEDGMRDEVQNNVNFEVGDDIRMEDVTDVAVEDGTMNESCSGGEAHVVVVENRVEDVAVEDGPMNESSNCGEAHVVVENRVDDVTDVAEEDEVGERGDEGAEVEVVDVESSQTASGRVRPTSCDLTDSDSVEVLSDSESEGGVDGVRQRRWGPLTRGEMTADDLPSIEHLSISVAAELCRPVGVVSAGVNKLVLVDSAPDTPALDIDTLLFLESGRRPLGRVYDVIGQVSRPVYCVRFNSAEEIAALGGVTVGAEVFFVPGSPVYTQYVFVQALRDAAGGRGSDASWWDCNEPPEDQLDFSDDECERQWRQQRRRRQQSAKRPVSALAPDTAPATRRHAAPLRAPPTRFSRPLPNPFIRASGPASVAPSVRFSPRAPPTPTPSPQSAPFLSASAVLPPRFNPPHVGGFGGVPPAGPFSFPPPAVSPGVASPVCGVLPLDGAQHAPVPMAHFPLTPQFSPLPRFPPRTALPFSGVYPVWSERAPPPTFPPVQYPAFPPPNPPY